MKVYIPNPDEKDIAEEITIHPHDTWSMDYTLAKIILPMLQQLKATKHGAPQVDDEDVPDEIKSTSAPPKENEWDADDHWFERWDWVLDEMIWAFEQKTRFSWEGDYAVESGEIDWEGMEPDSDDLVTLKWKKEPIIDWEGRKAHQERMNNGFRLFGKYYEGLWD